MDTAHKIPRSEVLRRLGHRGQAIDDELLARVSEVISACETELTPKSTYRIFDIEAVRCEGELPSVSLRNTPLVLEGKDIARHLEGAHAVAVLALTLGAKSERRLRQLSGTDPLAATVYDAACSSLIEHSANRLSAKIEQEVRARDLRVNRRYSPGYGDFPLAAQSLLLASVEAFARIGLTCNSSDLLIPTKSITAIMGLFAALGRASETSVYAKYNQL